MADNNSKSPLRIDDNLLQQLGLGALPAAEKKSLQNHIYETLEMRVGMRLADQMTNEQLDEFEQYFNAQDDAGAFRWLETNFPNYKDIVAEEFEKLKAEVAQSAPQILAASQQAPPAPQQPPAGYPQQQPAAYDGGMPPATGQGYGPQGPQLNPNAANPYAQPPSPQPSQQPQYGQDVYPQPPHYPDQPAA